MLSTVKNTAKKLLLDLDLVVMRNSTFQEGVTNTRHRDDMNFILSMPNQQASQILKYLPKSKAQYRQDLFALSELNFKRNGFFVEFGATNGVDISNTYLLETEFGWSGILAEPARRWHAELKNNRNCRIETDCVWKQTGATMNFREADRAEISTLSQHMDSDMWSKARKAGTTYAVQTISLSDMLARNNAPSVIDYLSVDTEGSELEILSEFDFDRYMIRLLTVEHNFTPERDKLHDLLTRQGFQRKFEALSHCDDWYVNTRSLVA